MDDRLNVCAGIARRNDLRAQVHISVRLVRRCVCLPETDGNYAPSCAIELWGMSCKSWFHRLVAG